MHTKFFAAAVALFQLSAGLPLSPLGNPPHRREDEPCKLVRDEVAKWMSDNGIVPKNLTETESYVFPRAPAAPLRPSTAFACLKSVPLHKDTGLQHLDLLRPLFEWQSTLDYLRDPPKGYLSEGVDIIRGLDDIEAKLKKEKKGGYANEFEFLADLHTLTAVRPRDFHFFHSALLMNLFTFSMGPQFVAVSEDGLAPPKIYLHGDIQHAQHGYTPSPVSAVDGVPVLEFLGKAAVKNGKSGQAHDPDARFNALLRSVAIDASAVNVPTEPFALDLKDTTTVKFGNGTKLEFSNTAFVRGNFTNITSGADLYDSFGQGNGTAPQAQSWEIYLITERNFTSNLDGYPEPRNATSMKHVAGFLPDGPGLDDVAALTVNSFVGSINPFLYTDPIFDPLREFYNVTIDFLRGAKAANRTKLILDVQGNGGGFLVNLLFLYRALFPGDVPLPILWQLRAHPQLAWLGKQLWDSSPGATPWPLPSLEKADGTPWESFEEYFGPYADATGRGAYTHPALLNETLPGSAELRFDPPWTEPPFKPEDIVVVTDGRCGSACALLVSVLVHVHGVRTVALGGRPIEAPMQAIGQTKGGPVQTFGRFPRINTTDAPEGLKFPPPPDRGYKTPLRLSVNELLGWSDGVMFNVANIVPLGEEVGAVPLQFRYEAANCRLFFTWEMARDITAVWKAAAGAAWRGAKCVAGSTTNADGTMGGVPGYTKKVEDKHRLGEGPGAVKTRHL